MCGSAPKAPKPAAPPPLPETVDQAAVREGDRERRRAQTRYGRAATILTSSNTTMPSAARKTLLGS